MNEQFINNVNAAIEGLKHQDLMLFRKEDFVNSVLCKSKRHNGHHLLDMLCDNMLEKDSVLATLEQKLSSITEKRIQLLAQIDVLEDLKEEAFQGVEVAGFSDEFFSSLFE